MSILQPMPSLKHQESNRYPLCPISLAEPPGSILRRVSPVIIDTRGSFPFLLFRLRHEQTGLLVHCVRGSASFPSEQCIERMYTASLGAHFLVDVQGGGRIHFGENSVQIHGSSATFGRSDHHLVGKLIKFCYPKLKVQFEPPVPATQQLQTPAPVPGKLLRRKKDSYLRQKLSRAIS